MKSITLSLLLSALFLVFFPSLNAQTGKWKFKEIIYGNHGGSENQPDKLELNLNEGFIEFSLKQNNNCTDRYRVEYKFHQDMTYLNLPEVGGSQPEYSFEFELKPLTKPCKDLDSYNYSNPYVWMSHWNTTSGLLGDMKRNNTWRYKHHKMNIDEGSTYYYAHATSTYKNAGRGTGKYVVTGPNQNDTDYFMENYPGYATDFRIIVNGQSSISGSREDFKFDILFVYELVKENVVTADPCAIEKPDCSCCPGTIPVWNFQTNKGECMCPEGQKWDKMSNRCVN